MNKRLKIFLLMFTLLPLFGCSPNKAKTSTPINLETFQETGGEKKTLEIWDYFNTKEELKAMDYLMNEYEKYNPTIKVNRIYVPFDDMVNKLKIGAATGQLPDLLFVDSPNHQSFAADGILEDITDKVKELNARDQFFPNAWSSNVYNGKIYGIPMGSNNVALYYNADMLKSAGLNPPTNWQELEAAAAKLTTSEIDGFQVTAVRNEQSTYCFLPFIWQSNSDLTTLNSKGTIEALKFWKGLIERGSMSNEIINQDLQKTNTLFINQKIAMMVNGTWQVHILENDAKFNWGVVMMPANDSRATSLGGENWAITSTSKHKELAWDFIKFSQREDILKIFLKHIGRLPARKDIIQSSEWQEDKNLKVFSDSMNIARPRAYGPNYPQISEVIQDMIQQVLGGIKQPEEAVSEANKKIKVLLDNKTN